MNGVTTARSGTSAAAVTNGAAPVRSSTSTRPHGSEMVSAPLRAERATVTPFSTPRTTAIRLCSHASRSKSQAGTSMTSAPSCRLARVRSGKSMSLQIATAQATGPARSPSTCSSPGTYGSVTMRCCLR